MGIISYKIQRSLTATCKPFEMPFIGAPNSDTIRFFPRRRADDAAGGRGGGYAGLNPRTPSPE